MQRSKQFKINLGEVLLWANWIEYTSCKLSFPLPPEELWILFVVQSVTLAHSLNSFLGERLPEQVVAGHIRGYLLDRVSSYQLVTELVQRDVRARCPGAAKIDSKQLSQASRMMVARLMLRKRRPAESAVRAMAVSGVLYSLKLSVRK